jgi:hypothetical protein
VGRGLFSFEEERKGTLGEVKCAFSVQEVRMQ